MDTVHLLDLHAHRETTRMMGAGEETLTSANIDDHEARLRAKIVRAGDLLLHTP
jgi:hypothetical protein